MCDYVYDFKRKAQYTKTIGQGHSMVSYDWLVVQCHGWSIFPKSKCSRRWVLPHLSYYIGVPLIIVGVIIRCTAVITLKKAFTLSVQTTNEQNLIKTGLYYVIRNPAYTGSIISLLGVAFAYCHILGVIAVIIICFVCYGIRINIEEKALKAQFKEEFEQYCNQTKYRLIPRIY